MTKGLLRVLKLRQVLMPVSVWSEATLRKRGISTFSALCSERSERFGFFLHLTLANRLFFNKAEKNKTQRTAGDALQLRKQRWKEKPFLATQG